MMLYINGQDIRKLTIALFTDSIAPILETYECAPEGYLKKIDDFLSGCKKKMKDFDRIIVVIGPGSATALRSILSIVNTLAFTYGVEILGIEKTPLEKDENTVEAIQKGKVKFIKKDILLPIYSHGPRITISKKDQLGRSDHLTT